MKVLLQKNISKLGKIGDVVEVKPGYARNYLLPQGLAARPTKANLKAIKVAKQRNLAELARQREQIEARAAELQGMEITLSVLANEEGHLYGSVGPAQICAALAKEGVFVDPQNIRLAEPIQQLDKYEVPVHFAEGATATIQVWIVPVRDADEDTSGQPLADPGEVSPAEESGPDEEEPGQDDEEA